MFIQTFWGRGEKYLHYDMIRCNYDSEDSVIFIRNEFGLNRDQGFTRDIPSHAED